MKKVMKRDISVLLTVLMLLSSWVFVAPQKAEALVDQETYDISVMVNIENENDRDDNYYTIRYIRPNGSIGSVKKERAAEKGAGVDGNADYREDTFTLDGIPISLHYCCNGYEFSKWMIEGVSLTSGDGATLFEGRLGARTAIYYKKVQGDLDFQNQTIYLEDHGDQQERTWNNKDKCTKTGRPQVTQVTIEDIPEEVQIPNEPGEYGETSCRFYVKDQFGVRLGSRYYTPNIAPVDSTQSASISASPDAAYETSMMEGYAIRVSEGAHRLQTVNNNGTWGGGGAESFDEPLTLTVVDKKDASVRLTSTLVLPLIQPTYDVYFSECDSGDGTISPASQRGLTYSLPIGELPSADRIGHTFLGFYTVGGVTKDANNIPSSFGTRITEDTIVVGENENTPYRAGWAAAPCTVTVLNNRGQTIATYTGQYGYTLADSINTGYNYNQLVQRAAYVKAPGESGEFNNLQPSAFIIESGYDYTGSADQTPSEEQVGQDFRNVVLQGDITVRTRYTQSGASQYKINFYDNTATALEQGTASRTDYTYGTYATLPSGAHTAYTEDNTYTYQFVGWAAQRHEGDYHYFVDVKEDGTLSAAIPLVDVAQTPITADVNYVAVYSRTFKQYSATFHYTKDGDEQIAYTQEDAYHFNGHVNEPESVTRETESGSITENPKANFIARGYTWVFDGWYTAENGGTKVFFNDMTDPNALMDNTSGKEYWAHYTQGAPTKNLIRFFTKNGVLLASASLDYSETDNTSVPALEQEASARLAARNLLNYDTETTRYTFDKWVNVQNGEELPYSDRPLTPADYYPSYIEDPLITIRLYNEKTELYSYKDVPGKPFDISELSAGILTPTRPGDAYSETYDFKGWSPTESFLWTEGEELVDLSTLTYPAEDLDLYAHFEAVPIEYTVRFLRDDKTTVISTQTLHFGDEITVPELSDSDKTKEPDYNYSYQYMGWNLEPAKTCFGDVDYFMTFRNTYNYYTVKWLSYDGTTEFKTDKYVYGGHIHSPYNTPETPAVLDGNNQPDTTKANVFDHWEYVNANGEGAFGNYVIGQKLGGATQEEIDNGTYTGPLTPAYWAANSNIVYLRATYELTDNWVTITKYDGIAEEGKPFGEVFGTTKVIYGTTLGDLGAETSPYTPQYTETTHFKFSRWERVTSETTKTPIADSYAFTEDTAIVESFTEEQHGGIDGSLWRTSVTKAPTFTEEGLRSKVCTADGCGYRVDTDVIPVLKDTTAPTGIFYVKDIRWTDYVAALNTENPESVALNSMLIVNADDTANNAYDTEANTGFNARGDGSGIASIQFALVRAEDAPQDASTLSTWYTTYTYDKDAAPNASLTIKNLIGVTEGNAKIFPQLVGGDTFVVYVKLTDNAAAANAPEGSTVPNVTYLRSDVLVLDTTNPTIEITSTDGLNNNVRHCEDATITIADTDLASVVLNGKTDYQTDGVPVTVTDVEGTREITVDETTYALNDQGQVRYVNGEGKYVYAYNDGENDQLYYGETADETTYTVGEGEGAVAYTLVPLYEYRYNTATEEEPVYETYYGPAELAQADINGTTYSLEEMHTFTYTPEGEVKNLIELVGEGLTITKRGQYQIVATDKAGNVSKANFEITGAHKLVNYIVEPTCTSDGLRAKRCTVCGILPEADKEVLPALGHNYSHKVVPATCTVNGREYDYCDRCGEIKDGTTVPIEATGHVWQSREDAYVLRAATCSIAGVLRYNCVNCSATKNEAYDALDPAGDNYRAALAENSETSASVYGHSLYASETLPATCTQDGDVSRQCKYCGNYFVMEVLHATGHTPSTKKFKTIKEATCEESGLRAPYCANDCGTVMYSATQEIAKTLLDVNGLTEKEIDGTVYSLNNNGEARAKVAAAPDKQTYTAESADVEIYNGRALTALYAFRYNTADEGADPNYVTHFDVADATEYNGYALEQIRVYSYTVDGDDFTVEDVHGKTSLIVNGVSVPLTDIGQARATVEEEGVTKYVYEYDLNDAEQYLYTYIDGDETKYFQSNNADETEYDGKALTALYVYQYNTAAEGDDAVYETVNAPAGTTEFEGHALTILYEYSYTVIDNGEFGDTYLEVVPALGHNFKFVETVAPTEESEGYDLYRCARCGAEERRNIVPPTRFVTLTVNNIALDEEGNTVETAISSESIQAGTALTQADLGANPTLEANNTFRYVFKGWSTTKQDLKAMQDAAIAKDDNMPKEIGDDETMPETDEAEVTLPELVTLPLTIEEDTTLYAVYQPRFINYVITLYKEDGTSRYRKIGYLHYGNEVSPEPPEKPEDAYGSYAFTGWQMLNPEAGDDTAAFEKILITKNASYKATYAHSGEVKKYVVFWMYGTTKLGEVTVTAGEDAVYTGATPDAIALGLKPTEDEHYYFSGWSGETTNVTENMRVYAQFERALHEFNRENTEQTCTTGAGYKQVCSVCGFFNEFYTNAPLGHQWSNTGDPVLPIVRQDGTYETGSQTQICGRCGETQVKELLPVELNVTVKDTNGTALSGAKVTAYRDNTEASRIMSAYSGSDGVAHLLMPVAGKYRIVVEYNGKQATSEVTVDGNGKVTGGSLPVIRAEGAAAGCPKNCTCHKSGLWPTIYRAIYKFIYFLTRTRCCPDATYI